MTSLIDVNDTLFLRDATVTVYPVDSDLTTAQLDWWRSTAGRSVHRQRRRTDGSLLKPCPTTLLPATDNRASRI